MLKKVIFLDRDGVINKDSPSYIRTWADIEFLPGSIAAISRLTAAGYTIIIISNQSVIGRKMSSPEELEVIFNNMRTEIEAGGGEILDVFYCPHLPEDGCECRKPAPGMVHQAAEKYDIDLSSAGFIGDSAKDMVCGKTAGCAFCILVESGCRSDEEKQKLVRLGITPDHVAADLAAAAKWIIKAGCALEPDKSALQPRRPARP